MGVIKKQGITNMLLSYIGILIGFVNIIFIQPHFLKPEEMGLMRVLYSFAAIVAMFLPLGIGNVTLRYFPYFRNRDEKHHGILGLNLLVALVGFILIGGLILLFQSWIKMQYIDKSPLFAEYFNATLPLCLFVALNALLTIYCQSIFKSSFPVFLNDIFARVGVIIWISAYYLHLFSFDTFVVGFVGLYAIQLIIFFIYINIVDTPGYKIDFHFLKTMNIPEMVRYGLVLALTSFASLGIKFIDMVLLGHYVTLAEVGIYSVAVFIPIIIEAPLLALEKISNAKISDEWSKNNVLEISKIYSESTRYLTLLGGFIFCCLILNIHSFFTLLPPKFSDGIGVVVIVSLSTLFNTITGLNGSIIFSSSGYRYGSAMLFVLLILSIVNCMILIPLLGIYGAALGIAIASLVYNILKFAFIWKRFNMQPFNGKTLKLVLLILFNVGCIYFLPHCDGAIADIVLRTILITMIYGGGVIMMNIAPEFHRFIPGLRKILKEKN